MVFIMTFNCWACDVPTKIELIQFLEGASIWTEVKDDKSFELAETRPVFLEIPFDNKDGISIRWGDNHIKGSDITMCWADPDHRGIAIKKGFFKTTFKKVRPGLLKSWIPIDGDLFYRKDPEVIRPVKLREPAKD